MNCVNDGTISESIGCMTSVLVKALSKVKSYPEILSQELKTCAAVKCTAGLVLNSEGGRVERVQLIGRGVPY